MSSPIFEDFERDEEDGEYEYILSSPNILYKYFQKLKFDSSRDVILDIGSGLGKALCLVFSHFFKKSIGIEINRARYEISKNNIKLLKLENKVEVKNMSVFNYIIPVYVNVVYFFNPFYDFDEHLKPLKKVLNNIKKSYNRNPRTMHIFFYNPENQETIRLIKNTLDMKIISASILERNTKIYHLKKEPYFSNL